MNHKTTRVDGVTPSIHLQLLDDGDDVVTSPTSAAAAAAVIFGRLVCQSLKKQTSIFIFPRILFIHNSTNNFNRSMVKNFNRLIYRLLQFNSVIRCSESKDITATEYPGLPNFLSSPKIRRKKFSRCKCRRNLQNSASRRKKTVNDGIHRPRNFIFVLCMIIAYCYEYIDFVALPECVPLVAC